MFLFVVMVMAGAQLLTAKAPIKKYIFFIGILKFEMNKIKGCLVSVQARGGALMPFPPMGRERYKSDLQAL